MSKVVNDFKLNSMRISNYDRVAVTWALPMDQCEKIGWLALEGICRQETRIKAEAKTKIKAKQIEWELLVMEENGEGCLPFGYDRVMKYQYQLQQAGCKRIRYFPLPEKLSFLEKLKKMAGLAKGDIFIIQHPYSYPQPKRLAETVELMKDGATVCYSPRKVFIRKKLSLKGIGDFNSNLLDYALRFDVAVRTEYLRDIEVKSFTDYPFIENHLKTVKNENNNLIFGFSYLRSDLKQVAFDPLGSQLKVPQEVLMRLGVVGNLVVR